MEFDEEEGMEEDEDHDEELLDRNEEDVDEGANGGNGEDDTEAGGNEMEGWAEVGPDGEQYTSFRWEGDHRNRRGRMVPQGFMFPVGLKIRPMMGYWYCGMPWKDRRIRPLKFLCTARFQEDLTSKLCMWNKGKAKCVMK
eukprot:14700-Hanusia_phi.AAC.1